MNLIIVGCGRVGAELAISTQANGHKVAIIDRQASAFSRLNTPDVPFHGRTIHGDVLHLEVLERAGIEEADGIAAVTPDDQTNLVVSRMASQIFQIPHVVARVFDPNRLGDFEALGIQAVASSSWASRRVELLLTHPGIAPLLSLGHGEVLILEMTVPSHLVGQSIENLVRPGASQPIALVRAGQALVVQPEMTLGEDDLVVISVARSALAQLETSLGLREG